MDRFKICFVVGLLCLVSTGCLFRQNVPAGFVKVTDVIDGDTFRGQIGRDYVNVRLLGIDTPETHGKDGLRECFGEEASTRLRQLLPEGTFLRMERDRVSHDIYDRVLLYAWKTDGTFVNADQLSSGAADILHIAPNSAYAPEFLRIRNDARRAKLGLWGQCGNADVALDGPK